MPVLMADHWREVLVLGTHKREIVTEGNKCVLASLVIQMLRAKNRAV